MGIGKSYAGSALFKLWAKEVGTLPSATPVRKTTIAPERRKLRRVTVICLLLLDRRGGWRGRTLIPAGRTVYVKSSPLTTILDKTTVSCSCQTLHIGFK